MPETFNEQNEKNELGRASRGFARCVNAKPAQWQAAAWWLLSLPIDDQPATPVMARMRRARKWIFDTVAPDSFGVDLHEFGVIAAHRISLFLALTFCDDFDGAVVGLDWPWVATDTGDHQYDGREMVLKSPIMFDSDIGGYIYRQRSIEIWRQLANEVALQLRLMGLWMDGVQPTSDTQKETVFTGASLTRLEAVPGAVAELKVAHAEGLERLEEILASVGAPVDGVATFADPTGDDLCSDPIISTDTLRRVRFAAGIKLKLKGAAARNRRYTPKEVDRLIAAAIEGNFIERTAMAEKWAKWGSKKAASKPHASK